MEGSSPGRGAGAAVRDRRRFALPALLLGSFMGVLDPFVVTVALPAIRSDLAATAAQTQWMVAGYGTTYAVGLVLGGRLGDRCGRRRLFLAGMSAYAAASVAAGVAPAIGALVGVPIALVLAAAPDDAAGAASGVLLTTTQIGNSVGVTGIGTVFFAVLRPDAPAATAYAQALAWSVALLAGVTAMALVVMRRWNSAAPTATCRTPAPSSCPTGPRRSW